MSPTQEPEKRSPASRLRRRAGAVPGASGARPARSRKRKAALLALACLVGSVVVSFAHDPGLTVSALFAIAVFLVMMTVLVSVHEFSHLLAAKALGVEVLEFGIGFPPRLLSKTAHGMKWSLCALPAGAFVALKGEHSPAGHGSFATARAWRKVLILVAGPLSNIVLAFAMLFGMAMYYSWSQNLNFSAAQDAQFASAVMSSIWDQSVAAILAFFPHAASAPMSMPIAGMPGLIMVTSANISAGWDMVVILAAILSFSLGVTNLLPISVLDGGRALATIIKGVSGRFYPARVAKRANLAYTVALFGLVALVQGIDLVRVVTGNFPGMGK